MTTHLLLQQTLGHVAIVTTQKVGHVALAYLETKEQQGHKKTPAFLRGNF